MRLAAIGQSMRLYDFARLHGSRVMINERISRPLGLMDGCQVYLSMFRYERNGASGNEIVASTFGPENYRQICSATFYMDDTPGSCAQVAKFLADRNIDILNSVSISMISNVTMVWKMLVDLSYYGEVAQLKEEFEALRRQKALAICNVEGMEIEVSHISERYTRGIVSAGSNVKVKPRKNKAKTVIRHGDLDLPKDLMADLEGVEEGALVMMVADTDAWVLSLSFLPKDTKLAEFEICIPDKPGAVFEVTNALAKADVNLLALYTRVLVYYERMTIRLVADVTRYEGGGMALMKELSVHLPKLEGRYELLSLKELKV
jgi:predicted amino acid-binding ACT domain protein